MKKYLLVFVLGIILSLVFSLRNVSSVQADVVGEGERCGQIALPRSGGNFQPDTCQPGFICEGRGGNKTCVREIAPPAECTCLSVGNSAPGANGFQCPAGQPPTGYCREGEVCYERDGQPLGTNILDQQQVFSGRTITGVECRIAQEEANCECLGSGRGGEGADANNFKCKLAADATIEGTATCRSGERCRTVPVEQGTFSNVAQNQRGALFDRPGGVTIRGVLCENPDLVKPSVPPLPPVPPPPCAPGKLIKNNSVCTGFLTAFGEIATDTGSFIRELFGLLLSMSGGIALLLIIRAGYVIMTSSGKPEQLKTGQEQLIAAIVGLVFIIFSFVILQVIGVDILRIPGFA